MNSHTVWCVRFTERTVLCLFDERALYPMFRSHITTGTTVEYREVDGAAHKCARTTFNDRVRFQLPSPLTGMLCRCSRLPISWLRRHVRTRHLTSSLSGADSRRMYRNVDLGAVIRCWHEPRAAARTGGETPAQSHPRRGQCEAHRCVRLPIPHWDSTA
jgi:hypothetical protein